MKLTEIIKKQNPDLYQLIKNSLETNKLAHAYLFSSTNLGEINNEPILLINSIIEGSLSDKDHASKYSDLYEIDGAEGIIKKEYVTKTISKVSIKALDSRGIKILFIRNIENGNKQSLNSLLKFIEEPTKDTYIVMTTNNINNVLSTIRSRSQIINIKHQDKKLFFEQLSFIENKKMRKIISQIAIDEKEAKKLYKSKKFLDLVDSLIDSLEKGEKNKFYFSAEFNKLITKTNYEDITKLLRLFFNDIWRYKIEEDTSFEIDELSEYINNNYAGSLKAISDFKEMLKRNVNFDLSKTRLLQKMEDNYE